MKIYFLFGKHYLLMVTDESDALQVKLLKISQCVNESKRRKIYVFNGKIFCKILFVLTWSLTQTREHELLFKILRSQSKVEHFN